MTNFQGWNFLESRVWLEAFFQQYVCWMLSIHQIDCFTPTALHAYTIRVEGSTNKSLWGMGFTAYDDSLNVPPPKIWAARKLFRSCKCQIVYIYMLTSFQYKCLLPTFSSKSAGTVCLTICSSEAQNSRSWTFSKDRQEEQIVLDDTFRLSQDDGQVLLFSIWPARHQYSQLVASWGSPLQIPGPFFYWS